MRTGIPKRRLFSVWQTLKTEGQGKEEKIIACLIFPVPLFSPLHGSSVCTKFSSRRPRHFNKGGSLPYPLPSHIHTPRLPPSLQSKTLHGCFPDFAPPFPSSWHSWTTSFPKERSVRFENQRYPKDTTQLSVVACWRWRKTFTSRIFTALLTKRFSFVFRASIRAISLTS